MKKGWKKTVNNLGLDRVSYGGVKKDKFGNHIITVYGGYNMIEPTPYQVYFDQCTQIAFALGGGIESITFDNLDDVYMLKVIIGANYEDSYSDTPIDK